MSDSLWTMDCSPPGSSVHIIFQVRILDGLSFSSSRNLPDPGIKPMSLASPALQADSLPLSHLRSPVQKHTGSLMDIFLFFSLRTLSLLHHPPPLQPLPPFSPPHQFLSLSPPAPSPSYLSSQDFTFNHSFFFSSFNTDSKSFLFLQLILFPQKCCLSKVASLSLMWTFLTCFL